MSTVVSSVPNSYVDYARGCIQKYIDSNGKLPQKKDIENEVSVDYLINSFGSWNNALVQLGFKEQKAKTERDKEEMATNSLNMLISLRDELKVVPSIAQVKEANIEIKSLIEKYGGWNEVKKLLKEGFTTIKPKVSKSIKSEEQLQEIKNILGDSIIELTNNLKRIPTVLDLKEAKITMSKIMKHFKTWNNAKEELKLEDIEKNIIAMEIIETQKSTVSKVSAKDLEDCDISYRKVKKYFGSWKNAVDEIGLVEERKNSVKDKVVELANRLKRTPSCKDIKEEGIPIAFITKETPWVQVKREWELDNIENSYIMSQIVELSKEIDYTPTIKEIRENEIKISRLLKQNGGWNKVREIIGLPKHSKYKNSYIDSVEQELLELSEKLGRTPTLTLAKENGIKVSALKARYGSWNDALFSIGLKLNSKYTDKAIDQLTQNIKDLASAMGRTPTLRDLKEHNIPINPLRRKYGSFEVCYDAIGLTPNTQTSKTYDKDRTIKALKSLTQKMGKAPSAKVAKDEGIKLSYLIKEIGSWKKVKEIISRNEEELQVAM